MYHINVCVCLYLYMSPLPLAPPSHYPYPTPLSHHRVLSWAPCAVQQLPTILHMIVYICQSQSLNSSHPLHVHVPSLYVCISIFAL